VLGHVRVRPTRPAARASSYRAEISAGGLHQGSRSLEDSGPSCSSLADAIAITIAMFLDPYAATPVPRMAVSSTAVPTTPNATPPRESLQRPPPWRSHLTLDLAGGASFGALAQTAPLMAGRLGWRATERWSLAVGGAFLFPDAVSAGAGSVDLGLSYGYLTGCARAVGESERARLDWCAAALVGSLYGQGHGYENIWTKHAPWTAIAAGPEIVLPFTTWLAWSLGARRVAARAPRLRCRDLRQAQQRFPHFARHRTGRHRSARGAMREGVELASFEAAYRRHFAFGWRALRRLGVPERDLGDATQDVFVVVYRKFQEFDSAGSMAAWVYAICLRVASDRRRSAAQRNELLSEASEPTEHTEHSTTEEGQGARQAELRDLR
jgi:Sigma-70 region 2